VAALADHGIRAGVYYPGLVHDHPCYRDHPRVVADRTPVAAQMAAEVVSLPVHPQLGRADLDRIVEVVTEVLR
jgi:dTDP-4-amino-4,6-dideoxygalactose transaminase